MKKSFLTNCLRALIFALVLLISGSWLQAMAQNAPIPQNVAPIPQNPVPNAAIKATSVNNFFNDGVATTQVGPCAWTPNPGQVSLGAQEGFCSTSIAFPLPAGSISVTLGGVNVSIGEGGAEMTGGGNGSMTQADCLTACNNLTSALACAELLVP